MIDAMAGSKTQKPTMTVGVHSMVSFPFVDCILSSSPKMTGAEVTRPYLCRVCEGKRRNGVSREAPKKRACKDKRAQGAPKTHMIELSRLSADLIVTIDESASLSRLKSGRNVML